jgi:hypothetical protein
MLLPQVSILLFLFTEYLQANQCGCGGQGFDMASTLVLGADGDQSKSLQKATYD